MSHGGYRTTSTPVGSIVCIFSCDILHSYEKTILNLTLHTSNLFFAVIRLLCCDQIATPENDHANVAWTCQFVIKSLHTLRVNPWG